MLPFPITIRPDEKAFGTLCFILDIGCDVLLFLHQSRQLFRWWAFNMEKYTLYQLLPALGPRTGFRVEDTASLVRTQDRTWPLSNALRRKSSLHHSFPMAD
jgi:hypothetical protein